MATVARISSRWVHPGSGRVYAYDFNPPAAEGKDDETGEDLMQRPDDTADALVQRLESYHAETVPVLDHYKPNGIVSAANANQGMDEVWTEIEAGLTVGS